MRNLLIFLTLFLVSLPSLSQQDFAYFSDARGICKDDPAVICSAFLTSWSGANKAQISCSIVNTTKLYLRYSYDTLYSNGSVNQHFESNREVGTALYKTCNDGERLKLEGCTATCEVDPCKQLEGTTTSALVSCGTAVCQAGSVIEEGSPLHCSNGVGAHLRSPASSTVIDGCLATNPQNAVGTKVRLSEAVGKSSAPAYCTADYTFTGASAPVEAPLTGLTDLSFLGVTPTTEDGQCPANTTKGQLNGGWVCVPNSGSDGEGGECDTGQIKVGGVCTSDIGGDGDGDGEASGGGDGEPCSQGQIKVNGTCVIDTFNGCNPNVSICEGSGDGSASTGGITAPEKIENTIKESWWESEYEDGLEGIWDEKKADLENTPVFDQLNQFKNLPDSGSCPSFYLSLGRYSGSIEPPCMIWPVLRAFFLFTAAMVCRRIIFGG